MIATLERALGWLADAPPPALWVARATAVLAAAWLADRALARRNPRWRVLTWRAAALGLAALVALAALPPILEWRVAPPSPPPSPPIASATAPAEAPAAPIPPDDSPGLADASLAEPPAAVPLATAEPTRAEARPALVEPTPAGPPGPPIALATWLLAAWLVGVALLGARLAVGAWRLARIVRRAEPAPPAAAEACRATAARLGIARPVRVVLTPELASPCLTGVARPVVLLPKGAGLDAPGPDLEAVLVHELTHVHNRDLAWNDALHLASIALWFHPLAWRARAAHAAACDAVCDATAVDQLGDVAAYGRALARLALKASGPVPARGLAMARACDVRRRVAALQRMVHRAPLPRRLVMPAILLSAALVALIGGTAVLRAHDEPPTGTAAVADEAKVKTLTVLVRDAEAGGLLQGAVVKSRSFAAGAARWEEREAAIGPDGAATVEYPAAPPIASLLVTVRQAGRVPAGFYWSGERRPIQVPDRTVIRLAKGTTIGGVVTDASGRPIEGAEVDLSLPMTESDLGSHVMSLGTPRTDAEGRWRIDEAPADLQAVRVRVEHPRYRGAYGFLARGLDGVTAVLTRGLSVTGTVRDAGGQPVAGARVVYSEGSSSAVREARTGEGGEYVLENCGEGPASILVQADGHAPQDRPIQLAAGEEPKSQDFTLEAPSTLRVRVLDVSGEPVEGAYVAVDRWHDSQSLDFRARTDAEGRAVWRDAPKDPVLFDVFLDGFMRTRQAPLTADDAEHVVVLRPALTISGRVTDAETGRPIPSFTVFQGRTENDREGVNWRRDEPTACTDGRYVQSMDFPARSHHLLIEAAGYRPAESRAFLSDEGATTQDFALERQAGVEGVVLLPDGRPAEGAEVVLITGEVHAFLKGDAFDRTLETPVARTGPDGRFAFPKPVGESLLVAAAPEGFATAAPEAGGAGTLRLAPWGRIEGRVRVGAKPGASETMTFAPDLAHRSGLLGRLDVTPEILADAEGRFVFDKLPPWPGSVGRSIVTDLAGGGRSHTPSGLTPVAVESGKAVAVEVGGGGRPVVGRFVLDGPAPARIDWRINEPVKLKPVVADQAQARPDPWQCYAANLDEAGRFRVEDVPPGAYRLDLPLNGLPDTEPRHIAAPIGRATLSVVVPEGPRAQPVDLGDVTVKLDGPPKAEAAGPKPALEGMLLRPDGKPAWGARVMLFEEGMVAGLDGRAIEAGDGTPSAEVRGDGRFSLARPAGDFRLVVASNHGYAEATAREFAESTMIRLADWGRVEGVLRIGGRPAAGETAYLHRTRATATSPIQKATADAEGRFVFEDVPPGPAMVWRLVVTHPEEGETAATPTDPTPADVAPGTTTKVIVGDRGRPVIGRLVVDDAGDGANIWRGSRPVVLIEAAEARGPGFPLRLAGPIDEGGRFRIENVPPGAYRLQFPLNKGRSTKLVRVSVPGGDRDVPVDLGDVTDEPEGPRGTGASPVQDEPTKTIVVRVLDAETGGALEGVRVEARSSPPGDGAWRAESTGGDGVARVVYRDDAPIRSFDLRVNKPGRVPAYVRLTDDRRPIEFPASRKFRLERGTTIGGVVKDELGAPVEGATVSVTMPMTELEAAVSNVWFSIGEAKTDARGRWRIDEAPADLGRVRVGVRHPRHLAASGDPSRDLDAVTAVLKKGQTVRGRVRGPDGAPIGGASVVVGDFFEANGPRGTTDAGGAFAIDRCKPGPTAVTVQAEGFSPQDRLIDVPGPGAEAPPLDLVLERGATLRLRVVDDAGRPVEGAYATVMGWHGRHGLRFMAKTDADGRVVWTSAPRDSISFQAGKDGYLAAEKLALTASDEEHVFVLHPELKVVGRVTDAETGRPIPKFSVLLGHTTPGREGVSWDMIQPLEFTDGRYLSRIGVPAKSHHILIEAPGYKPAASRAIGPDEGEVVQDFALERRPAIEGVVLRPDGRPAWGADVAIVADETGRRAGPRAWGEPASPPAPFSLRGHRLQGRSQGSVVRVGPEGRFSFPRPEGDFLVVAATAAGYAEATAEDFARSSTLQLAPWGRIEGVLKVGDAPVANGRAFYVPTLPRRFGLSKGIIRSKEVQADAEGRFVIDELPPWPGRVGRKMVTARPVHGLTKEPDPRTVPTAVGLVPVEVRPGETTRVEVGGRGRAVVGRIVVDGPGEAAVDWRFNRPVVLVPELRGPQGPPDGASLDRASQFGGTIDADGRFRVDDVAPGAYQLRILVDGRPAESPPRRPEEIGRATLSVDVPDGERARPVDVGDVKVRLESFLEIGGEAPALDLPRLDGPDGRFVLADRRGKLVLLTFWSAASQESRKEMEEIKRLREAFGDHPRFEIVGVSCDAAPEEPARHAESHGLDWTQAFAGPTGSGPAQAYRVDRLPTTFLIDADGRIILWDEEAGALKEITHKRLVELGN